MNVLLLFALCTIIAAASPLWFDEEEPSPSMNWRNGNGQGGFRVMANNQLDTMDGQRRLLKRANIFNKRRGRELFGKRSLPIMDYPEDGAQVILEQRFRRRANELFG